MTDPSETTARRAWQASPGGDAGDVAAIRAAIEKRLAERRRRARSYWVSAAIIVPSWIAIFVWRPDLRPVAAIGLMVAAWLGWQQRHGAIPRAHTSAALPSRAHEREFLTRERDFQRALPVRSGIPVIIGQLAIVTTLLLNARLSKGPAFYGSLTLFIVTVAGVLTYAFRRARRIASELDRELIALEREPLA
jgi:hypothetical protein